MTDSRRNFLRKTGMLAGAFSFNSLYNQLYAADIEEAELVQLKKTIIIYL